MPVAGSEEQFLLPDEQFAARLTNMQSRLETLERLSGFAMFPIGAMAPFGGSVFPIGWLDCDGTPISRVTYPELFAVIGTNFGAGDGSSTFNLPDLRGRAAFGVDNISGVDAGRLNYANVIGTSFGSQTKVLATANLPAHSHAIDHDHGSIASGAGSSHTHAWSSSAVSGSNVADTGHTHSFADTSTSGGGSHTHSFSTTSASGGASHSHSFSTTSASGGGSHSHSFSDTSSVGSGNHSHYINANIAQYGGPSGWLSASGTHPITWGALTTDGQSSDHTHLVDGTTGTSADSHTHTLSGTTGSDSASHTHTLSGTTGGTTDPHTHDVAGTTGGGSSHGHAWSGSVTGTNTGEAAHTHSVDIASFTGTSGNGSGTATAIDTMPPGILTWWLIKAL